MRKAVAIGLSGLVIYSYSGVGHSSLKPLASAVSHQYTHLIDNNQSLPLNRLSQSVLIAERTVSLSKFTQIASVTFITGGSRLDFGNVEFEDASVQACQKRGYNLTACDGGYWQYDFCPYNNEYFRQCCADKYKYTSDSCSYPNELSSDGCGGKYRCICNRTLYPVESCVSPQVVSDDSCIEGNKKYYSECLCPSNYNQICDGKNQEGNGEGCTYQGTTQYTGCRCKNGYNMTCGDLGPVTPSDYCLMNGIKYYNNCKTCENKCSLTACPTGVVCEKENCSGKYCPVGCAVNYKDLDNYWCAGALRCWFK